jgi:hypothetical protein
LIRIYDIEFGARDFDHIFKVESEDQAFAHLLLSTELRNWLLSAHHGGADSASRWLALGHVLEAA